MKTKSFNRFLVLLVGLLTMCVTQVWGNPVKCTSTSDLVAGSIYYISDADTYSSAATVMGLSTGGNNFPVSTFGGTPCELTLGGDATNGWTFSYVDGSTTYYLDPTSTTSNNYLKRSTSVTDYGKFTISFSDGAAVITSKGKSSRNIIRYNSSSSCYSCYSSGQSAVYLYKKASSGPTDATWSVEPASVTVKEGKSATATITTNYDGTLSVVSNATGTATASIEGKTITVSGVAEGSTTLLVTGAATSNYNAISKTIDVIVTANNRPAGEVFYESFDTNDGTGGNDSKWSGNIASNNIKEDNDGWVFENGYGANECAKFGTGSKLGTAQTPAVSGTGNFTLTFKAAAWNGGSESTTLKLSATNATLSEYSVTLTKGAWDTYNVNITDATTGFTINFEGNAASNSRFFLDEVSIVSAGPAGSCATPTFSQEGGSYCGTQSVTISCTTDGASIYYTTDGTTPTSSSTLYSSAISVSADMTIKAIAVKDGLIDSEVATATYSITDLRDTFIDNLHENATQYGDCDNYTVPSLSDATPASACEGEHYHFVGWSSAQLYTGQHATEPAGLLKAGSHHSADGTTYYAVWAKEQH